LTIHFLVSELRADQLRQVLLNLMINEQQAIEVKGDNHIHDAV